MTKLAGFFFTSHVMLSSVIRERNSAHVRKRGRPPLRTSHEHAHGRRARPLRSCIYVCDTSSSIMRVSRAPGRRRRTPKGAAGRPGLVPGVYHSRDPVPRRVWASPSEPHATLATVEYRPQRGRVRKRIGAYTCTCICTALVEVS